MKNAIHVRPQLVCATPISPFQYGQFVEYLCDLVPGMWAEKLCDNSFEGPLPYHVVFRKQTDFRERPWYPIGAVNRGEYILDDDQPLNGRVSQRVSTAGEPCTLGVAQDGVSVGKGKACRLSAYLRCRGLSGFVWARLRAEGKVIAQARFRPSGEWRKHTATLIPSLSSDAATFCLEFRGPGTLWVDQVSLMPEDNVGGWRPDVVRALKELRPGIVRFGGSTTETFEWRDLIGNPDKRPPWPNTPWGGRHPSAAGLEEFVQLCQAVGAEPMLCVRVTGKTPEEAAAQVEYFNGGPDSAMGRLRAASGHARPYGVTYWQVGNELGGDEYARRLAGFCAAMKKVDASLKLLSAFPSEAVLREAGQHLDYVCPHHYGCTDLAGKEADLANLRRMIARHAPDRHIKVAVTEWNTTAGDWGLGRAMLWTLDNALACSRYHNLLHRHADLVEIANRSNLTNSFCSGILQTDGARLYKTPTYYAQQLYAQRAGAWALEADLKGDLERHDVSATLSSDGSALTLFVVNPTRNERKCAVDLSALGLVRPTVRTWTLLDTQHAGERDVTNSFWEPERVRPVTQTAAVGSAQFAHCFPALSLTVLEAKVTARHLLPAG